MMKFLEEYIGWRDSVTSAMCQEDSTSWFSLVDPCADPRIPAILWELSDSPAIVPLFMNTMVHEVSMNGPLLVPLTPNSPITNWFLTESKTTPLGYVYSVKTKETDNLFDHLQNLLECALPNGKPGIFRFFDPRVLYAIANYSDQTWMQYVVGQATGVYAWEPGCQAKIIYTGKGQILEKEGYIIDQGLLDAISEHTSPYAVISSMKGDRGDSLRSKPLSDSYPYVRGICDSISSMNIPFLYDFMVGTSIVMQIGDNIFLDDSIREIVMNKKDDDTLLDVIRNIPDSFFVQTHKNIEG